ncbi:MAG: SoxR reducing system RseC family protein [Peptococcaceae bacterium]|nr:SoxR reducing system RseC family protein [Peptococcaceae bacterium]
MRQFGEIVELRGDIAQVRVVQHSACANCHQKCGLAHEMKDIYVEAKNIIHAKPGEKVTLELQDTDVLTAAFLVYVAPLIFLFTGAIYGSQALGSEIYGLWLGLFGLGGSFVAIKYGLEPMLKRGRRFHLAIVGYSDNLKCNQKGKQTT